MTGYHKSNILPISFVEQGWRKKNNILVFKTFPAMCIHLLVTTDITDVS